MNRILFLLQLLLPSLGVIVGVLLFPGMPVAQIFFALCKVLALVIPIIWIKFYGDGRLEIPRWSNKGMRLGLISGVLMSVAMYLAWTFMKSTLTPDQIQGLTQKAMAAGLDSPMKYLIMAIYWCTLNSLLEEFIWRWFVINRFEELSVFGRFRTQISIFLSALFFTSHHTLALLAYVPYQVNILASVGVFLGGVFWGFLYRRCGNIYAAWVSHILADVTIFYTVGMMLFGV